MGPQGNDALSDSRPLKKHKKKKKIQNANQGQSLFSTCSVHDLRKPYEKNQIKKASELSRKKPNPLYLPTSH